MSKVDTSRFPTNFSSRPGEAASTSVVASDVAAAVPGLDLGDEFLDPLAGGERADHGDVGGVHDDVAGHADGRDQVLRVVGDDHVVARVEEAGQRLRPVALS